jgi:predicted kinase
VKLIVFTGLPGVGKSTIAAAVGRMQGIPVFAKDWLEAVLHRCQLRPQQDTAVMTLGYAGYELLTTLAAQQLQLGQSAILDSVASVASIRQQWRELARQYGAVWRVIECICSDEALHRQRLAGRQRGIPGWPELTWGDVEKVRAYYTPWQEDRLILDAVDPVERNIEAAVRYISSEGR